MRPSVEWVAVVWALGKWGAALLAPARARLGLDRPDDRAWEPTSNLRSIKNKCAHLSDRHPQEVEHDSARLPTHLMRCCHCMLNSAAAATAANNCRGLEVASRFC